MSEHRLLSVFFCATLSVLSFGWPQTWPMALGAAALLYGFYHWLWLGLAGWFSLILAVLAVGIVLSAYSLGPLLLFLGSVLACFVFMGWELSVHIVEGWRAWRRERRRHREAASTRPDS